LFDFIPIFFLVASLLLVRPRPYLALFLLGLSLSFRHISAIILPLYCIQLWHSTSAGRRTRTLLSGAASVSAVPLIISLPFIIRDPVAFAQTLVFSFTRAPVTHFDVPSVDAVVGLLGVSAKMGLLALLFLLFYIFARKYIGFYLSALLAFGIFLDFHSVWFAQYMAYASPLFMLALLESIENKKPIP